MLRSVQDRLKTSCTGSLQAALAVRVGLMEHAFVSVAGGAGLIGVNARNDEYLVGHLLLNRAQTRDVIEHRVLAIGKTIRRMMRLSTERRKYFDVKKEDEESRPAMGCAPINSRSGRSMS